MTFSKIRQIRRAADMTQEELAKRAGISRTTLWKLEKGKSVSVSTETLIRIANILNCKVDDFFTRNV